MKDIVCLFFIFFLLPCSLVSQNSEVRWTKVADSVDWSARDSQGEVVYDGHMWIFGGWESSYESPPRDVWKSADGKNWQLVTDDAPWLHSDLPMSIAFKDKMWMMGGWYNGRLEDRSASNQVSSSTRSEERRVGKVVKQQE